MIYTTSHAMLTSAITLAFSVLLLSAPASAQSDLTDSYDVLDGIELDTALDKQPSELDELLEDVVNNLDETIYNPIVVTDMKNAIDAANAATSWKCPGNKGGDRSFVEVCYSEDWWLSDKARAYFDGLCQADWTDDEMEIWLSTKTGPDCHATQFGEANMPPSPAMCVGNNMIMDAREILTGVVSRDDFATRSAADILCCCPSPNNDDN